MSKRTVERDIEELGDEILPELSPGERLALFVETAAAGNEAGLEQLVETCPESVYRVADRRFVWRCYYAKTLADRVVSDLQTTYLRFAHLQTVHSYEIALGFERDEPASTARRERAADRVEALYTLYAQLYSDHHAIQRFATEVLEVDVHAWLALHHTGPEVFDRVTDCLDANESSWGTPTPEWMVEILIETDEGWKRPETPDKDQLAEARFEELATVWEDLLVSAAPDRPF